MNRQKISRRDQRQGTEDTEKSLCHVTVSQYKIEKYFTKKNFRVPAVFNLPQRYKIPQSLKQHYFSVQPYGPQCFLQKRMAAGDSSMVIY